MSPDILVWSYDSPCGRLLLGAYGDRLCLCDWDMATHKKRVAERLRRIIGADLKDGESPVIDRAITELNEYFSGVRTSFDVPLLIVGTEFQKSVWGELLTIPYGMTVTYGEVATGIGSSRSVRGVANATGANALSIFIPCHRVIGYDGNLTGYAGGLAAKQHLLRLERNGAI